MEELSLDMIFHNDFLKNVKSFSKNNSKPDSNQSKLAVCTVFTLIFIAVHQTLSEVISIFISQQINKSPFQDLLLDI